MIGHQLYRQNLAKAVFFATNKIYKPVTNCYIFYPVGNYEKANIIRNHVRNFFVNLQTDFNLSDLIVRDHVTALQILDSTLMILPMEGDHVRGRIIQNIILVNAGLSGPQAAKNFFSSVHVAMYASSGAVLNVTL